ncbi:MAG: nucleotidyl transferase AbiEii/AbiGii toxin family protein [Candidatus Omnitrophica bacterium]|nr:nucleotidyl transferase AbiEii/AbiGii toxin family protein [Candidatus Omnitrophota bacterium]
MAKQFPQVYLVGGTALSLTCNHRISEDLDFFTQSYSSKLHRDIAAFIKNETGFRFQLEEEEKRKKYVPMAVYEFEVGEGLVLKIDFVSDFAELLKPREKNGIASMADIYYRKMLAVIGWKAGASETGRMLAGGRQKTKDLYDIYFLSMKTERLSEWFPQNFDLNAYERLTAWYLGVSRQRTVLELLELATGCDTKEIFKHFDKEIIQKLNQRYFNI